MRPLAPNVQGPLRAAVAIFVVGFLFVWLIKPIGNPCPDLSRLPAGSSASSSPSFSPPGSRTCTYTAAGGTKATAKHVPWLDWIVLLLLAAVMAVAVRALSPAGRLAPEDRRTRARAEPPSRAERPPRAKAPPPARREPSRGGAGERDAGERERARQERAARNRERRPRA